MTLRRLQLETSWGLLTIAGGTRAGEGNLLLLPQLRLALDAGRPHRALSPMTTVCVSHGHLDHLGGLPYWSSQRYLSSMGAATALVPAAIADDVAGLLALHARLEGGRPYKVTVERLDDGSAYPLRPDLELRFFATDHWVPTLGSELVWRRRHLRPELVGLAPETIAEHRRAGEEVSVTSPVRVLSYLADTGPRLLARRPDLLAAEVVLLECSFYRPGDRERAARFGHLHLDDLVALAGTLRCRRLVLLHPSRRHRLREVEAILERELRPRLPCPLDHLMVDWE